ncbi:MAG: phosphotransferase [Chloroflexi bacterium]|nr:phosphotransferase [Chloroflexota bacterium]
MTRPPHTSPPDPPDDFGSWDFAAQKALYLELATGALHQWGFTVDALDWLAYSSNAVFALRAAGARYVLRLSLAGRVKESRLRSELEWLRAIRQGTDLAAPDPVTLRVGGEERLYALASHESLPPPHRVFCVLFQHIEGQRKSARELNPADCRRIGRYLGRLHLDAQFDPPAGFDRPRLDWRGLFDAESPYQSAAESLPLAARQRDVFADVAARVGQVMARLDGEPASFGLIHADLLSKNALFRPDSVAALDFEYSGWGYFNYDLAPLLWELRGERTADGARLEDALLDGYRSARPDAQLDWEALEAFIAARQLASCRWLLQNRHHPNVRAAAPDLIRQRAAELEQYLRSGELRRQSPTL